MRNMVKRWLAIPLGFVFVATAAPPPAHASAQLNGGYAVDCPTAQFCMAVGSGGQVLTFDGSGWSLSMRSRYLRGTPAVSCPSTTFCAVTGNRNTYTWDRGVWSSRTHLPKTSRYPQDLRSVSCPTRYFCMAIGIVGEVARYVHGTWSNGAILKNRHGQTASYVSCATRTYCVANGNYSAVRDDSPWRGVASPDRLGGITWISCPVKDFCASSDDAYGIVATFDGTKWRKHLVVPTPDAMLSVSCTSAAFCMATDREGKTLAFDGTGWTVDEQPGWSGDDQAFVNGVSCANDQFCVAVFGEGRYATFDGTSWSPPTSF